MILEKTNREEVNSDERSCEEELGRAREVEENRSTRSGGTGDCCFQLLTCSMLLLDL